MGWARANLLLEKYPDVPPTGSPMEILFLVLWRMRQELAFQQSRSAVQSMLSQQGADSKSIEKAFEDLKNSFFPFEKTQRAEEIEILKKVMSKELKRGALSVRPMIDLTRAKNKKKLERGDRILKQRASQLRQGALKPLEKDPFLKAKRRRKRSSAS